MNCSTAPSTRPPQRRLPSRIGYRMTWYRRELRRPRRKSLPRGKSLLRRRNLPRRSLPRNTRVRRDHPRWRVERKVRSLIGCHMILNRLETLWLLWLGRRLLRRHRVLRSCRRGWRVEGRQRLVTRRRAQPSLPPPAGRVPRGNRLEPRRGCSGGCRVSAPSRSLPPGEGRFSSHREAAIVVSGLSARGSRPPRKFQWRPVRARRRPPSLIGCLMILNRLEALWLLWLGRRLLRRHRVLRSWRRGWRVEGRLVTRRRAQPSLPPPAGRVPRGNRLEPRRGCSGGCRVSAPSRSLPPGEGRFSSH
eukprot:Hpha_TRINITY_DN15866_c0_g2::TRINITY_DN15866_c0_g2_i4::g.190814::m.190814